MTSSKVASDPSHYNSKKSYAYLFVSPIPGLKYCLQKTQDRARGKVRNLHSSDYSWGLHHLHVWDEVAPMNGAKELCAFLHKGGLLDVDFVPSEIQQRVQVTAAMNNQDDSIHRNVYNEYSSEKR